MSDPTHLEILYKGIDVWNRWRKENPYIQPNLSESNLSESNLEDANLEKADLRWANFSEANLTNAVLSYADLSESDFRMADLTGTRFCVANLDRAEFTKVKFSGADLSEAKLFRADLSRVDLSHSNLSMADLSWANLSGSNLSEANLSKANLCNTTMYKTNLYKTNLCTANLTKSFLLMAYLYRANLFGANLSNAILTEANLVHADLRWSELSHTNIDCANLSYADLSFAKLSDTSLFQTDFSYARFKDTLLEKLTFEETRFVNVDLGSTQSLETGIHQGPSVLDHRTLIRSNSLPVEFIRGCGLPEKIIHGYQSMQENPPLYSDCYISYAHQDSGIAQKLKEALQQLNVRCWLLDESKKQGDKIRQAVLDRIYDQEKLIVIFSHDSMNTQWIQAEIETAFLKEGELNRVVLLPICVDHSLQEAKDTLYSDIRVTHDLHDLSHWEEDETAFDRIIRKIISYLEIDHSDIFDQEM